MLNFDTQSGSENAQRTIEKILCVTLCLLCGALCNLPVCFYFIHTVMPPPGF